MAALGVTVLRPTRDPIPGLATTGDIPPVSTPTETRPAEAGIRS